MQIQKTIEEKLTTALNPTFLELVDKSCGCGSSFNAIIVSNEFTSVGLLDRQRLVHKILKEELESIHAFSMKCHTPSEYEKIKSKNL